jgi:ankyrin repeat protein
MVDAGDHDDPFDDDALHAAAQNGDLERLRDLLARGCDLNAFDDLGKTPLHYAAAADRPEVVRYLLERGANVNAHHAPSIGNTPLRDVAENCSLRMATLLVDAGADPTIPGWMQLTALHKAEGRTRGDGPKVYALLLRAAETRGRRR